MRRWGLLGKAAAVKARIGNVLTRLLDATSGHAYFGGQDIVTAKMGEDGGDTQGNSNGVPGPILFA